MAYFTGTLTASPLVNGSSGDTYGTHHSVLGIGGYLEVNSITERDLIPVNTDYGLYSDSFSSGKRRYGMLVYVASQNLTYRLLPNYATWLTLTNSQKVTALANNSNWVEFGSQTVSGERISKIYTQNLNGFVIGDVIGYNGTQFVKITSDKSNTVEPLGVINRIIDANNFELTFAGYITPITGITDSSSTPLTGGTIYYLSSTINGKLTSIKPTSTSVWVRPMLVTLTNNTAIVLQYQSNETGLYTAGNGINSTELLNNRIISVDLSSFLQNNNINITLTGNTNQAKFYDNTGDGYGLQYGANYNTTFLPSSLVDKRYVDAVATGLFPKAAAFAATTINIDLTGGTFGGTVDGLSIINGARILVNNQTNPIQNGVYDYHSTGNTFTRSSDFSGITTGITRSGTLVPVISGNTLFNTIWVVTTENPIIIGTTPIEFTLFSRVTDYIPGVGIVINANNIYFDGLNIAGNSISWYSNKLNVNISGGTLGDALFSKLNVALFNNYTGNTESILNYHQNEILEISGRTVTVTGTTLGNPLGNKVYKSTISGTTLQFRTIIASGGTQVTTIGDNIYVYSGIIPTGITSNTSISSQNISKSINKTLHGFGINDVVAFSGGTYIKAIANGTMDGETIGVVTRVQDGDNFTVTFAGYVSGLTSLTTSRTYFISDITPGQLSLTEPTAYTHISKPILIALSASEAIIFSYRGEIISSGATSGGSSKTIIIATSPTYNISTSLSYIGCSGSTTINLPASPSSGNQYDISDIIGNAFTIPITVNGNGYTINGSNYALINTNYGSISLLFNGYVWSVIGFS